MIDGSVYNGMREPRSGCDIGELREERDAGGLAARLCFHSARVRAFSTLRTRVGSNERGRGTTQHVTSGYEFHADKQRVA